MKTFETGAKGMATDQAKYGLQVKALAPGYFVTELNSAVVADPAFSEWLAKRTPAGRWGEVEELVGACLFLASDAATFLNGQTLHVDGGITASLESGCPQPKKSRAGLEMRRG